MSNLNEAYKNIKDSDVELIRSLTAAELEANKLHMEAAQEYWWNSENQNFWIIKVNGKWMGTNGLEALALNQAIHGKSVFGIYSRANL